MNQNNEFKTISMVLHNRRKKFPAYSIEKKIVINDDGFKELDVFLNDGWQIYHVYSPSSLTAYNTSTLEHAYGILVVTLTRDKSQKNISISESFDSKYTYKSLSLVLMERKPARRVIECVGDKSPTESDEISFYEGFYNELDVYFNEGWEIDREYKITNMETNQNSELTTFVCSINLTLKKKTNKNALTLSVD